MKIKKQITVTCRITEKDIANGSKGSSIHCPVALSLRRKGYSGISISGDRINVMKYDSGYICIPDTIIQTFIYLFDTYGNVKPTTLKLKFDLI